MESGELHVGVIGHTLYHAPGHPGLCLLAVVVLHNLRLVILSNQQSYEICGLQSFQIDTRLSTPL